MPASWTRVTDAALILAAIACLLLAGVRITKNISLGTPLQLVTSGFEQEALYSIGNCSHGQTVYTDPRRIPYTASNFNWAFYTLYGGAAARTLHFLHLGDAWLPTICRLLTLGLALTGAAVAFGVLRTFGLPRIQAFSLAIIALVNPLCGFWIITARPDIGASVLQLTGVAGALVYFRTERLRWIALSGLILFAAWSFKQTALSGFACTAILLGLLRRHRALILFTAVSVVPALVTLLALGPVYRHGLYLSQLDAGFSLHQQLRNLTSALIKMPFIPLTLLSLAGFTNRVEKGHEPCLILLLVVWLVELAEELVATSKFGAGDYYFIPLGIWSVLLAGAMCFRLTLRLSSSIYILGSIILIAGVGGIFLGGRGTLDCRDPQDKFARLATYLASRSGPVYVESAYGNLPWISPTSPHFVVASTEQADREAGVTFQAGGWQKLIQDGYFTTVVTDARSSKVNAALLTPRYRFRREDTGLLYFERK